VRSTHFFTGTTKWKSLKIGHQQLQRKAGASSIERSAEIGLKEKIHSPKTKAKEAYRPGKTLIEKSHKFEL